MPVFISDIIRSIIDGASAVYIGPNRVEVQAADGEVLVSSPSVSVSVAPVIISTATISGGPEIGSVVGGPASTFSGNPTPVITHSWYKDGVIVNGEDSLTIDTSSYEDGEYQRRDTATNSAGSVVVTTNTVRIEEATAEPTRIDYSRAIAYIDADTPFTGTDASVTAVTSTGLTSINWPATGTGNPITHSAAGFTFADGVYLQSAVLSGMPTGDGIFVVVDFTLTSYGLATGQLLHGTGDRINVLDTNGALRVQGFEDATANMAAGATPYGTRFVIGGRMDDVLKTMAVFDVSGAYSEQAHATTNPALTRISTGRFINGTLHRLAVFGRPEGGTWAASFEDVYADFREGA